MLVFPSHHYTSCALPGMLNTCLPIESSELIAYFFAYTHGFCFSYWTSFVLVHELSSFFSHLVLSPVPLMGEWDAWCLALGWGWTIREGYKWEVPGSPKWMLWVSRMDYLWQDDRGIVRECWIRIAPGKSAHQFDDWVLIRNHEYFL